MTPSSLNIALLTYSTKPRGSVVHTLELAEALHQRGHTVCIYALDKDSTGFDYSSSCRIHLISAQPAPKDMDALIYQRIREFVEGVRQDAQRYDIYHAQDCLSANALTQLRMDGAIPCLVRTVHHIENYISPYLRECQDRSIREADRCFCVSQHWQTELKVHYGIDAPRVLNGINTERFTPKTIRQEPRLQTRYGIRLNSPTFLTVGGIEPRKNSIRLLQAFALVLQTHPEAQLVIAGGATLFDYQSYRENFFAEANRLNISVGTSLILPGVIPDHDLPELYRLADVFVFPSLKEGWGMVVLEAIASGLPVIISNQPPFIEFLSSEQALWIDPNDENALADTMITALNPEIQRSLITTSQNILPNYSWDHSAYLHEMQYYQMLQSAEILNSEASISVANVSSR